MDSGIEDRTWNFENIALRWISNEQQQQLIIFATILPMDTHTGDFDYQQTDHGEEVAIITWILLHFSHIFFIIIGQ